MALKFCRSLGYTTSVATGASDLRLVLKLASEFWSYCINGGASVTTPGGLASPTPSTLPSNFLDPHTGTTVLMASGTNAATTLNGDTVTSVSNPFTAAMVGKYITLWKAASGSSEDSVYQITAFDNAGQIRVNVANGGTPSVTTLRPQFTARTSINFRVIDANAASILTFAAGQYVVWQMTPTQAGQANGQIQIFLRAGNPNLTNPGFVLSPGGTWNGSAFTDGTTETQGNQIQSSGWFQNATAGLLGSVTMIGDKDGLIVIVNGGNVGGTVSSGFHFEMPTRNYPQANDLNPLTVMTWGQENIRTNQTTTNYGGGFVMRWQDGVTRKMRTISKSYFGNGDATKTFGHPTFTDGNYAFSTSLGKVLATEAGLAGVGVAAQYQLNRCRFKYLRLISAAIPSYHRVGDNGEYIHLQSGVCVPWDNTILPSNLLPYGI